MGGFSFAVTIPPVGPVEPGTARISFTKQAGTPTPVGPVMPPAENLIYFLETVTTDGATGYDTGDPYLSLFQDSFSWSFFITMPHTPGYGYSGCDDKVSTVYLPRFTLWFDNVNAPFDKQIKVIYQDGQDPGNQVLVQLPSNSWGVETRTHFTVVINNSTRTPYIYKNKVDESDGQFFGASVDMSTYNSTLNPFLGSLNKWSGEVVPFIATFDHVRYYNIPLTPDQVTAVYDNDL